MKRVTTIREAGVIDMVTFRLPDICDRDVMVTIWLPSHEIIDPSVSIRLWGDTYSRNLEVRISWQTTLGKYPDIRDWRKEIRSAIAILMERLNAALYG